jgi:hypothetical protein
MSDLEQTVVDVPNDAPVETQTDVPPVETPEPTPEEVEAKAKADAEEVERKKEEKVQKRIGRERALRGDAERKAQELEQRLAQYEKPKTNEPPQLKDFASWDDWDKANREHIRTEAIKEHQAKQDQERQAQTLAQVRESFAARERAAAADLPDYDDVARKAVPIIEEYGIDPEVFLELANSEHGALMSYELCSDTDALEDFLKLPKATQLRKLGALEAKVAANPPKSKAVKVSSAPAPLKPVSANAPIKRDPYKAGDDEFLRSRGIR